MPDASSMLLVDDFEEWAEKVLTGTGWNYYRSAADREISECFNFGLEVRGSADGSSDAGERRCLSTILSTTSNLAQCD